MQGDLGSLQRQGASVPSGSVLTTVAGILTAAADLIEPEGRWVQRAFKKAGPSGPCWCAAGAVMEVADDRLRWSALNVLGDVVKERVPSWNDAPERTQAEVVAALRAAAEKARTADEIRSVGTDERSEGVNK